MFFAGIMLIVMLFVSAVLLRVACAICQVESPDMLKAMGITLAVWICHVVVGFIVGVAIAVVFGNSVSSRDLQIGAQLLSAPLQMCVGAAIYMLLIPTSIYRGILIWILWYIVLAVIVVSIVVVMLMLIAAVR